MTYIIKDGAPIARTIIHQKSGPVRAAYQLTGRNEVVNSFEAKLSNAKKWESWEERNCTILPFASLARGGIFIHP